MNINDIERREKEIEARFITYRNVNRMPFVIGLPFNLFISFVVICFCLLMLSLIFIALGMWYISILIFLCAVAFFFSLTGLVKKFGNSFLEKLTAYYTVDTFKTIRVNRKVENIVKKRNAKNNI